MRAESSTNMMPMSLQKSFRFDILFTVSHHKSNAMIQSRSCGSPLARSHPAHEAVLARTIVSVSTIQLRGKTSAHRRLSPKAMATSSSASKMMSSDGGPENLPAPLLTRRIADSPTGSVLSSLLQSHQTTLNPIHLAAAAKATRRLKQQQSSPSAQLLVSLMTSESFAPSHLLLSCPPRELSSIAWACVQVFPKPGPVSSTLSNATKVILSRKHNNSTPQGLSSLLWAFALWSCFDDEELLELLCLSIEQCLVASGSDNFSPQDISMLLWSFAKLSSLPSITIIKGLLSRAISIMEQDDQGFTPQGLSNVVWSAGILSKLCSNDQPESPVILQSLTQLVVRASSIAPSCRFKLIEISAYINGLSLLYQSQSSASNSDIFSPSLLSSLEQVLSLACGRLMSHTIGLSDTIGVLAGITAALVPLSGIISHSVVEGWIKVSLDIVLGATTDEKRSLDLEESSSLIWALCKVHGDVALIDPLIMHSSVSQLIMGVTSKILESEWSESAIARILWACTMMSKDSLSRADKRFSICDEDVLFFLSVVVHKLKSNHQGHSLGLYSSILWALSSRLDTFISFQKGIKLPSSFKDEELDGGWGVVTSGVKEQTNMLYGLIRITLRLVIRNIDSVLLESSRLSDDGAHQNNISSLCVASSR